MTTKIICIYCATDMHFLCEDSCECDTADMGTVGNLTVDDSLFTGSRSRGAPVKVEKFKDVLSTGRKRAAMLYPITAGKICEWAWQKNCGGGIVQIMGCTGRPAKHIHHGPDKSVLNNARDNISLICNFCHNLWHAKNDPYYIEPRPVEGTPWLPLKDESLTIHALSDMEPADHMEVMEAELTLGRKIDWEQLKELGILKQKKTGA